MLFLNLSKGKLNIITIYKSSHVGVGQRIVLKISKENETLSKQYLSLLLRPCLAKWISSKKNCFLGCFV